MSKITDAEREAYKALECLYLAVDTSIADDVNTKVRRALQEARQTIARLRTELSVQTEYSEVEKAVAEARREAFDIDQRCYFDCAMCGSTGTFVIDPHNPSVGYCFEEKAAWVVRAAKGEQK